MKKFLVALGLLSFLAGLVVRGQDKAGHAGETDHVVVRPAAIEWGPSPPSLPPGSQMAVLVGDPSKPVRLTCSGPNCPMATSPHPTGSPPTKTSRSWS
jgi:hypothetical protein